MKPTNDFSDCMYYKRHKKSIMIFSGICETSSSLSLNALENVIKQFVTQKASLVTPLASARCNICASNPGHFTPNLCPVLELYLTCYTKERLASVGIMVNPE